MVRQLLISPLSSFARDFTLSITTITIIVITIISITITITIVIMMVAKLQIAKGQSFAALGMFSEATTNLVSSSNQSITIV